MGKGLGEGAVDGRVRSGQGQGQGEACEGASM